jgi:hypothetical protein
MNFTDQRVREDLKPTQRFTPIRWWASVVGASVVVISIAMIMFRSYIPHKTLDFDEAGHVYACESRTLNAIKPQPEAVNLAMLASIHSLCYQEVAGADVLVDFGIRKSAYINQQIQTTILMWMVVAITLSGVALAGLQLVAGYKLAAAGKAAFEQGGQLSIEHSKISLGSSVTGLMILAISLVFFIVFVTKVYLIQETHTQSDAPVSTPGLPATPAQPTQPSAPQPRLGANPDTPTPQALRSAPQTHPGPSIPQSGKEQPSSGAKPTTHPQDSQ